MAADAAGFTMDEGACRCRHSPTTTSRHLQPTTNRRHRPQPATSNRHHINASTTSHQWNAGRSSGLIKTTTADIPRRIRPLKRGTTAHRTSRFRMGCASRTRDVRSSSGALEAASVDRLIERETQWRLLSAQVANEALALRVTGSAAPTSAKPISSAVSRESAVSLSRDTVIQQRDRPGRDCSSISIWSVFRRNKRWDVTPHAPHFVQRDERREGPRDRARTRARSRRGVAGRTRSAV
jgi:hypothetical protein